jgi:hypothetical protein
MGWDEEEYNGVRWRRGEEGGRTVCEWRKGGSFRGGIGVPGDDGGVNVRFWRRCMVRACLFPVLEFLFCRFGLSGFNQFPK